MDQLRGLLVEQIIGGYRQAISIEGEGDPKLVVQNEVQLQRPRSKMSPM